MNQEDSAPSSIDNIQNAPENFNDTLSNDDHSLNEPNESFEKNVAEGDTLDHDNDAQNHGAEVGDEEDNDIEAYDIDGMTGSYVEISFDQEISGIRDDGSSENKDSQSSHTTIDEDKLPLNGKDADSPEDKCHREKKRPNSLVLSKNSVSTLDSSEKDLKPAAATSEKSEPWKRIHRSQQTSDSQTTSIDGSPSLSSEEYAIYSPRHQRTGSDTSGLSDLQGTITVDGDMVSFVAEDLQEKIKLSSPVSKWAGDSPSYSGSRCSTPSLYKQALHSHIPLVDPGAIADLEVQARKVASCVGTMLEKLSGSLQSISFLTLECMETYEASVCKTCDSVDTSIKTMYQLMAKCEELSNSVRPLYKISQDIKDIKKALDRFESAVEHKS